VGVKSGANLLNVVVDTQSVL